MMNWVVPFMPRRLVLKMMADIQSAA